MIEQSSEASCCTRCVHNPAIQKKEISSLGSLLPSFPAPVVFSSPHANVHVLTHVHTDVHAHVHVHAHAHAHAHAHIQNTAKLMPTSTSYPKSSPLASSQAQALGLEP